MSRRRVVAVRDIHWRYAFISISCAFSDWFILSTNMNPWLNGANIQNASSTLRSPTTATGNDSLFCVVVS